MVPAMGGNPLVAVFRAAVEDEPDNIYARFNLANLLAAEDRHQEAITHLDRVNALVPGYEGGAAWLRRGDSLVALGRYAEAVASFDRVLRIPYTGRCSHATTLAKKAAALDKLGRRLDAKTTRTQAEQLGHREGLEWLNEGNMYHAAGEHLEAVASYDKSIAFDWRGRPVAQINRGLTKKALGKLDEALADIQAASEKAAALSPADLGRALMRAGESDPSDVTSVLDQLVAQLSEAFIHYNRASVRVRLGNLPGAADDLRAALALVPELAKEVLADAGFKAMRQDPAYADLWPDDPASASASPSR
jgi:tetratricopeptide (TPR) repeat protein